MNCAALLCALAGAASSVSRPAGAQQPLPPRATPELRADLISGPRPALQIGGGVHLPIGFYVRVGIAGAAGIRIDDAASRLASGSRTGGRVDLLARFLFDPFRQTPYGLSFGGGLSLRVEPGDRVRPVLLVAVDVEGRRSARGLVPAVQVGLGDGVRIGVVVRRGGAGRR